MATHPNDMDRTQYVNLMVQTASFVQNAVDPPEYIHFRLANKLGETKPGDTMEFWSSEKTYNEFRGEAVNLGVERVRDGDGQYWRIYSPGGKTWFRLRFRNAGHWCCRMYVGE